MGTNNMNQQNKQQNQQNQDSMRKQAPGYDEKQGQQGQGQKGQGQQGQGQQGQGQKGQAQQPGELAVAARERGFVQVPREKSVLAVEAGEGVGVQLDDGRRADAFEQVAAIGHQRLTCS